MTKSPTAAPAGPGAARLDARPAWLWRALALLFRTDVLPVVEVGPDLVVLRRWPLGASAGVRFRPVDISRMYAVGRRRGLGDEGPNSLWVHLRSGRVIGFESAWAVASDLETFIRAAAGVRAPGRADGGTAEHLW